MLEDRVPKELEFQISGSEEDELVDDLILTPSQGEGQKKSADLILEAEKIIKFDEITFDGEKESEARIRKAMEEYDDAMDKAAAEIVFSGKH